MPTKITPLLTFLRALTKEQRIAFAKDCGTTEQYLYQLAADEWPNPRLRFAKALVTESKRYGRRVMQKPLTLDDLLIGTADDDAIPPPPGPNRQRG